MKKSHILLVAIISLLCGFVVSWVVNNSEPVKLEAGLWFGEQAKALPEFELIDHNGQPLNNTRLLNRWSLMFFGYTHCPDVCPTTLQDLGDMMKAIKQEEVRRVLQVVFVSVDPERDSAEILKNYVQYFNPDFVGATAALPALERLTSAVGIMHSRDKTSEGQVVYGVSHSSSILLINPRAKFSGLFSAPHNSIAMANDLTRIIDEY